MKSHRWYLWPGLPAHLGFRRNVSERMKEKTQERKGKRMGREKRCRGNRRETREVRDPAPSPF